MAESRRDIESTLSRRRVLALGAAIPLVAVAGRFRPQASPVPAGQSAFFSVTPARLADTRDGTGFTRIDANTIRVAVAGRESVPGTATTAVLNITALNCPLGGFVTAFPGGGARPTASNLNLEYTGQVISNLVTVSLGSGAVDIFTQNPADLVVDVAGAFVPVTETVSAGRFVGLASAQRVLDTRTRDSGVGAGETERVDLAAIVPDTASAVVLNLTVTEATVPGFWTAHAAGGARPGSSNLNTDFASLVRANQAIVPIGSVGSVRGVDVFASTGGQLIVDVAGYFTGAGDAESGVGLFVASAPVRALDTRTVAKYGRLHAGWVAEFDYAGRATSQAVVANLTVTDTRAAGFFTGYPARTTRPLASHVNATRAKQTVANHAILRASTAGVAVFTQTGGSLIVDIAGYFTGVPANSELPPPVNVVPPASPAPYTLASPNRRVGGTVVEGTGADVLDNGLIGIWPNTSLLGLDGHMVLFGNRSSGGGVFRFLHTFTSADIIVLTGADGRQFVYEYHSREIVDNTAEAVIGAADAVPGNSVSLVSNSKPDFTPTDIDFQIIVSFTLVET